MKILSIVVCTVLGLAAIPVLEANRKKTDPVPLGKVAPVHAGKKMTSEELAEAEAATREREEAILVASEIGNDRRKPTRENLSGLWKEKWGLEMEGSTFQLEQQGDKITGRGYWWGCLGLSCAFRVTGNYRNGVLDMTFFPSTIAKVKGGRYTTEFAVQEGYPRLVVPEHKDAVFKTVFETREADEIARVR